MRVMCSAYNRGHSGCMAVSATPSTSQLVSLRRVLDIPRTVADGSLPPTHTAAAAPVRSGTPRLERVGSLLDTRL